MCDALFFLLFIFLLRLCERVISSSRNDSFGSSFGRSKEAHELPGAEFFSAQMLTAAKEALDGLRITLKNDSSQTKSHLLLPDVLQLACTIVAAAGKNTGD